ncbi:hypothetical protein HaLaN_32690, partial [Haematococcus lacustris]
MHTPLNFVPETYNDIQKLSAQVDQSGQMPPPQPPPYSYARQVSHGHRPLLASPPLRLLAGR